MASKIEVVITAKDEASPAIKQVAKATEEITAATEETTAATTSMAGVSLNAWIQIAEKAWEVAKQIYEVARAGAELQLVEDRFDNLTKSIGTTSEALLSDLRKATRGLYSDTELMTAATDFMSLGLAKSHDEAVRLAAVSAGLNMNMNQLVLTLTNMTTMRFDALGVSVDGFKDKVKALEAAGYDADAAFKEAFLQQAEQQLNKVGHAADSNIGIFMRLESSVKNASDAFKVLAADAVTPLLSAQLDYHDELQLGLELLARFQGQVVLTRAQHNMYRADMERLVDEYQRAEQYGLAWERALQQQAGASKELSAATEEIAVSMEAVKAGIQGTIKDATDKYDSSLASLQVKHADLTRELETLQRQGWQPTSDKILDVTQKLKDNEQAQLDAAAAMQTAIDKMIFQQASAGLDAAAQLELARAMGILDEESYNVALATQALKKEYDDGKISAEEYAKKVAELRDTVNDLKDKNITITANLLKTGNWDFVAPDTIGGGNRYSKGTEGWEQVPPGYPNDTYPIMLTSGERFAVIPQGQNAQPVGGGVGGNSYSVVLQVNSPVTVMDEEKTQNVLIPMLEGAMREMEIRGTIKGVMN